MLLVAVFAWSLASVGSVRADAFDDFRRAQRLFEAQDFQGAARRLEGLVGGEVPQVEGPLRLESRKYLGASYVFLERSEDAERQFEALLEEDPQHRLDPVAFSRDVVELFDRVRVRLSEAAAAEEERRRQAEEEAARREVELAQREQERVARLEALARQEVVEVQNSRFLASIPFGVGQFQNGDEVLGWTFLTAGAVFAVTSIVTGLLYLDLTDQLVEAATLDVAANEATVQDIRDARDTAALLNRLSILFLGVVGIAGVVDAHVRYVPSRREVRPRQLDEDDEADPIDESPDALDGSTPALSWSLGPLGGQISWAF